VMSLRDGTKKMSKSDESDLSRINLTDDADAIANKIRKAKSDSDALPTSLEGLNGRAEVQNLLNIYAALTGRSLQQAVEEFAGQQFSGLKQKLTDALVAELAPVASEMRRLLADPAEIDRTLREGAARARAIAAPVVAEAKKLVGFVT